MSFYTSLSGLKGAQTDLNVISNNVANVGTIGFKKSRVEFGDLVTGKSPGAQIGLGSRVSTISQQFAQGSFQLTDRALDLAISGDGFFVTRNDDSTGQMTLTRKGAFGLDGNRFVTNEAGAYLQVLPVDADGNTTATGMGAAVNLQIPADLNGAKLENVTIDNEGLVVASFASGETQKLGKVAIAKVANPAGLQQLGDGAWAITGKSGQASVGEAGADGLGALQSGALEQANVDITEELVALISAQRNFQANAKAIETANAMTQTVVGMRS